MSPDEHITQEHASNIVRAVVAAARSGDRAEIAFDICGAAMLMADVDQQTRSSLAWFMRRCAEKLDHDVTDATLQ